MTVRPELPPRGLTGDRPLDRALRACSPTSDREKRATALLLALNVFLLLAAYYCIRPVREALILSRRGCRS